MSKIGNHRIGVQESLEYKLGWDWAEHGMDLHTWMERHLDAAQVQRLRLGWQDYHDQEKVP